MKLSYGKSYTYFQLFKECDYDLEWRFVYKSLEVCSIGKPCCGVYPARDFHNDAVRDVKCVLLIIASWCVMLVDWGSHGSG
jgi:hypothetical protein